MKNHFNFKRTSSGEYLITNDFGRHLFLGQEEFQSFVSDNIRTDETLEQKLKDNYFLIQPTDLYNFSIIDRLRDMKSYLFASTSLHIFVVTNACNLSCVYCQAQDKNECNRGMMSKETAKKALEIALQSPSHDLTFEFQGGEPLLNFDVIRYIVETTEKLRGEKHITYTLVSNLSLLTADILDFLISNNINISTSIDGPESLHNQNRNSSAVKNSFQKMMNGVELIRSHNYPVAAIQTTTKASLQYPAEIVDTYCALNMPGIFLRPLSPLGFAKTSWEAIGYTTEDFLVFYKKAFQHILEINMAGKRFPEQHACFFLKKILCGKSDNYMELRSPCGASIGQLAYYYNGEIYTCDEGRMIAEAGDPAFRLGTVDDNYQDLVSSKTCMAISESSVLESIPGCCDCVYQPYCGVCPVVNYSMTGDIFNKQPRTYRCAIYKGILDFLFSQLESQDNAARKIMESWVEEN